MRQKDVNGKVQRLWQGNGLKCLFLGGSITAQCTALAERSSRSKISSFSVVTDPCNRQTVGRKETELTYRMITVKCGK